MAADFFVFYVFWSKVAAKSLLFWCVWCKVAAKSWAKHFYIPLNKVSLTSTWRGGGKDLVRAGILVCFSVLAKVAAAAGQGGVRFLCFSERVGPRWRENASFSVRSRPGGRRFY